MPSSCSLGMEMSASDKEINGNSKLYYYLFIYLFIYILKFSSTYNDNEIEME